MAEEKWLNNLRSISSYENQGPHSFTYNWWPTLYQRFQREICLENIHFTSRFSRRWRSQVWNPSKIPLDFNRKKVILTWRPWNPPDSKPPKNAIKVTPGFERHFSLQPELDRIVFFSATHGVLHDFGVFFLGDPLRIHKDIHAIFFCWWHSTRVRPVWSFRKPSRLVANSLVVSILHLRGGPGVQRGDDGRMGRWSTWGFNSLLYCLGSFIRTKFEETNQKLYEQSKNHGRKRPQVKCQGLVHDNSTSKTVCGKTWYAHVGVASVKCEFKHIQP